MLSADGLFGGGAMSRKMQGPIPMKTFPGRAFAAPLAVCLLATACAQSAAPATDTPLMPTATSAAVLTPSPLPSGLEPRGDLPPLEGGEVAACTDLCGEYDRITPGSMQSGRYQTSWFFGGYMTIELGSGWSSLEDSVAELHLFPPGEQEYGMHFGLDAFPVADGRRVADVPNTAAALVDWLRSNPRLRVSEPTQASIGDLPALSVEVANSDTAENEAPDDCPAPVCVLFWGDDYFDHVNGIAGDDVYRFFFADVEYSGSEHVLSLWVEGRDRAHLDTVLPLVEELLATVTVPASALQP